MICEKCGKEMKFFVQENTQGWKCENCGYSLVTTYFSDIEKDYIDYSIEILPSTVNSDNLKLVSQLSGCNYIESKKTLDNGGFICKAKAIKVKEILKKLEFHHIAYKTFPNFPYK